MLKFLGFTTRYQYERSNSVTSVYLHQLREKVLSQISTPLAQGKSPVMCL